MSRGGGGEGGGGLCQNRSAENRHKKKTLSPKRLIHGLSRKKVSTTEIPIRRQKTPKA